MRLSLDHVCFQVDSTRRWADHIETSLGFRLTPSPGAEARHGRIVFQGGYIEVADGDGMADDRFPSAVPWYFLRSDDSTRLVGAMEHRGITLDGPRRYVGVSAEHDDFHVVADAARAALPIFTHCVAPPEVVRRWAPSIDRPHPNGSHKLVECWIAADESGALSDFLGRLSGSRGQPVAGMAAVSGARKFSLDEGAIVVAERVGSSGTALATSAAGIFGLAFEVDDLAATSAWFERRGIKLEREGETRAWLPPGAGHAIWMGFRQA